MGRFGGVGSPEAKNGPRRAQEAQNGSRRASRKAPGSPERPQEAQKGPERPQESNGKRPARARRARVRASRENSFNLPSGPPDQRKLETFAAKPPDFGKCKSDLEPGAAWPMTETVIEEYKVTLIPKWARFVHTIIPLLDS